MFSLEINQGLNLDVIVESFRQMVPINMDQSNIPQFIDLTVDDPRTSLWGEAWKVQLELANSQVNLPLKNVGSTDNPVRIAWYNPNFEEHAYFGALALTSMLMQMPDKKHIVTISSTKSNKMIDLVATVVSKLRGEQIDVTVLQKVNESEVYVHEYHDSRLVPYKPITSEKQLYLVITSEQTASLQEVSWFITSRRLLLSFSIDNTPSESDS